MSQKFYTNARVLGNTILHRYIEVKDGLAHYKLSKVDSFMPTIFTTSSKPTGWKNLYDIDVLPTTYDSIRDAKDWIKTYDGVDGIEIHGTNDFLLEYVATTYPGDINYNSSMIRTYYIDIECSVGDSGFPSPMKAEQDITAITLFDSISKTYHVFGTEDIDLLKSEWLLDRKDIVYYNCGTEKKLLTSFVSFWKANYPDIVSGWNIISFDIPYIVNRLVNVFGEDYAKTLSPWNKIDAKDKKDAYGNSDVMEYDIWGVEVLDYIELYKKYVPKNQESYSLDFIANLELGVGKLEFEGNLTDLYNKSYTQYIAYNVIDVERVVQINEKRRMIDLQCNLAYRAKLNYSDAYGPVKLWTGIIYNTLLEEKTVLAPKKHVRKDGNFTGAIVIEPKLGMHKWVVSVDATALYPSMIISFNISPETLIRNVFDLPEELHEYYGRNISNEIINKEIPDRIYEIVKEQNLTMTAAGQFYRRDKVGILPRLAKKLGDDRRTNKNKMLALKKHKETNELTEAESKQISFEIGDLSTSEQGLKICNNALYGACGNEFFHLFDIRNAEAITLSGQTALLTVGNGLDHWLTTIDKKQTGHVLAGDTDSVDGSSLIDVNGTLCRIDDLYNKCNSIEEENNPGKFVKSFNELVLTSNDIYKPTKYIAKHKVTKRMFRIKISKDQYVDVTEDHSIMIYRDDILMSVPPRDLLSSDEIIIDDTYFTKLGDTIKESITYDECSLKEINKLKKV